MSDRITPSGKLKLRLLPSRSSATVPVDANPPNSTRPLGAVSIPPSRVTSPPNSSRLSSLGTATQPKQNLLRSSQFDDEID